MGYYERNLPHWQPEGKRLFVTWRLDGSLPASVMGRLRKQKAFAEGKHFLVYDRELDSGRYGPLWLNDERVALSVVDAIQAVERNASCLIRAYVVMPNHVHLLLEPRIELSSIMKLLKGRSARAANKILDRTGKSFWQDESFDHWVRDGVSLERTIRYIEGNPVKAGLVNSAAEWRWSSAQKSVQKSAQTEVCATGGDH